jgi:hypothetical protein
MSLLRNLFIALLAAAIPTAFAAGASGSVIWAWSAPTTYADGTALPSGTVITYNLYVGTAGPGSEAATPVQTGISALTVTTTGYSPGQNVCAELTAVVNGLESVKSNEACKAFPNPPGPPTGLTAQ